MSRATTALILGDLQNDFLHPDGAYGRAGQSDPSIAALPARLAPLVRLARERHILIVATLFTLVPGRGGEPIISPHLKSLRPFLKKGDFAPGIALGFVLLVLAFGINIGFALLQGRGGAP